jgi:two-component system sensor histidine kinase YesM
MAGRRSLEARINFYSLSFLIASLIIAALISFLFPYKTLRSRIRSVDESYCRTLAETIDLEFETSLTHTRSLLRESMMDFVADLLLAGSAADRMASLDSLEHEIGHFLLLFSPDSVGISMISRDFSRAWQGGSSIAYGKLAEIAEASGAAETPNRFTLITAEHVGDTGGGHLLEGGFALIAACRYRGAAWFYLIRIRVASGELENGSSVTVSQGGRIVCRLSGSSEELNGINDRNAKVLESHRSGWTYHFRLPHGEQALAARFLLSTVAWTGLLVLLLSLPLNLAACRAYVRPLRDLERLFDSTSDFGKYNGSGLAVRQYPRPTTLRNRLFLLLFAGSILPMTALGASSILLNRWIVARQVDRSVQLVLDQLVNKVRYASEILERTADFLSLDDSIQRPDALKSRGFSVTGFEDRLLRGRLAGELIDFIDVFDPEGRLLYSTRPITLFGESLIGVPDPALEGLFDYHWQAGFLDQRYRDYSISLVRRIRFKDSLESLGFLRLGMLERPFHDRLRLQGLDASEVVRLMDSNGMVFTSGDKSEIRSFESDLRDTGVRTYRAVLPDTGWTLSLSLREQVLQEDFTRLLLLVAATMSVLGLLVAAVSEIIASRVTQPLLNLARTMETASLSSENTMPESVGVYEETVSLSRSFSRMMDRLNGLVQEVYVHDLREKHAILRTLQYQVNPHFLYNTLAAIKFLIRSGRKQRAQEAITALGMLFRRSAGQRWISKVQEELEGLKAYAEICDIRYPDRLEFIWDFDEEALHLEIPTFLLQPLVENSVSHGIGPKNGSGTIRVSVRLISQALDIEVSDDGVGMNKQTLAGIRESLMSTSNDPMNDVPARDGGIGLRNVLDRIRLAYGQEHVISISSAPGSGTRISFRIPVQVPKT